MKSCVTKNIFVHLEHILQNQIILLYSHHSHLLIVDPTSGNKNDTKEYSQKQPDCVPQKYEECCFLPQSLILCAWSHLKNSEKLMLDV